MSQIKRVKQTVEYRPAADGRYLVSPDGKVLRRAGDGWETAPVATINSRPAVIDQRGNTHSVFYLSRLIAEAYVPRPEGADRVYFLDGNCSNLSVRNLAWGTQRDVAKLNYATGKVHKHGRPCRVCGRETLNYAPPICNGCREQQKKELHLKMVEKTIAARRDEVDLSLASPKQKKYAREWLKGKTVLEIAQKAGVSRQCVDASIKQLIYRTEKCKGGEKSGFIQKFADCVGEGGHEASGSARAVGPL